MAEKLLKEFSAIDLVTIELNYFNSMNDKIVELEKKVKELENKINELEKKNSNFKFNLDGSHRNLGGYCLDHPVCELGICEL